MSAKKSSKKPAAKAVEPKAEKPKAIAQVPDSKAGMILDLIAREGGATIAALVEATGWNKNTVRGFLSTAHTKRGLQIETIKAPTIYRLKTYAVKLA